MSKWLSKLEKARTDFITDRAGLQRNLEYWCLQNKLMKLPDQQSQIRLSLGCGDNSSQIELTEWTTSYKYRKKEKYGRVLQLMDYIILDEIKQAERAIFKLEEGYKENVACVIKDNQND